MAFQQLYYTSCEHGLGGYGGYQFTAITPGVPPDVLREVEERTVYEPPHWPTGSDQGDPEAYPVAFSYGISEVTGEAIIARAVSAGTDYSGRPGNYFVHALVTSTPEQGLRVAAPGRAVGGEVLAERLPDATLPSCRNCRDRRPASSTGRGSRRFSTRGERKPSCPNCSPRSAARWPENGLCWW